MAATGFTPLYLYYSSTAGHTPTAGNLGNGELAINIADGILFYKDSGGVVQQIASKAGNVNVSSISFGTTGLTPATATTGAVTVAGTLAIANGGTNATSFNSPASSINGLVWYDGTRLVNDATTSDVGYNASTNTFYAKNANVSANLQLGADLTSSAFLIGSNNSFIGRKTADGSTVINTGQGSILFTTGTTASYSTLASISSSTGLFSFPFQAQCGNDYTTSSYQIGTSGSYIGRDAADGSLKIYTGQDRIRFGISTTQYAQFSAAGGLSLNNTTDPGVGNLRFAGTSNGIYFGASSMLNDYEEGTYTPTVAATSGTITSYTSTGRYTRVGRLVLAQTVTTITNNGTGTGAITISLPFTNGGEVATGSGRENAATGSQLQANLSAGATVMVVRTYNNSYPGGTNYALLVSIAYSV